MEKILFSCAFGANIHSYTKQRARHGTPFLQPPHPPSAGVHVTPPPPPAEQFSGRPTHVSRRAALRCPPSPSPPLPCSLLQCCRWPSRASPADSSYSSSSSLPLPSPPCSPLLQRGALGWVGRPLGVCLNTAWQLGKARDVLEERRGEGGGGVEGGGLARTPPPPSTSGPPCPGAKGAGCFLS